MANAVSVFWGPPFRGYDIHLLWGAPSIAFEEQLFFLLDEPAVPSSDGDDKKSLKDLRSSMPANVDNVVFSMNFAFTKTKHGVEINDPSTGKLDIATIPPGNAADPVLRNFLVIATVTFKASGSVTPPPVVLKTRVHLHKSVDEVFLTPTPLTVHVGARVRHSVLARFDDDVIGDVSRHPGLVYSSADAGLRIIDQDFGSTGQQIWLTADAVPSTPDQTLSVAVTLPDTLEGSGPWTGQCKIAPAWNAIKLTATLISGPGLAVMDQVPNFLFLPDGYTTLGTYKQHLSRLVDGLWTDTVLFPVNKMKQSVNVFRAFLASDQPGSNYLPAGKVRKRSQSSLMFDVDLPEDPGSDATITEVEHLIHRVGLPVPADATRPFDNGTGNALERWIDFYDTGHIVGVDSAMYAEWLKLANYALQTESNTAFGMSHGKRPMVDSSGKGDHFVYHPFRVNRESVDDMIRSMDVTDGKTTLPGGTAGAASDRWRQDGRDAHLMVYLSNGQRRGGTRSGDPRLSKIQEKNGISVVFSVRQNFEVRIQPPAAGKPKLAQPFSLSTQVPLNGSLRSIMFHELAHTIHCGDEGRGGGKITTTEAANLSEFFNLQSEADLKPPGKTFLGPEAKPIRWSFPRLRAAALVVEMPTISGSVVKAKLRAGQGAIFRHWVPASEMAGPGGVLASLRLRPLLGARVDPSPEVKLVPFTGDEAQLESSPALQTWLAALTAADVTNGIVLSVSRRFSTGVAQPLVHPDILAHMQTTQVPLNRKTGATCKPESGTQNAVNIPTLKKGVGLPRKLIGVFDGGKYFDCGVFHPSGECILRGVTVEDLADVIIDKPAVGKVLDDKEAHLAAYCHVCRYIIADVLDPSLHGQIDDFYTINYPEPV